MMHSFEYPHKSWLEIDKNKILNNLKLISRKVEPLSIMAVLKANAYGLGIKEVAAILALGTEHISDIDSFGVAEIDSALAIKHLGKPIHLLGALTNQEVPYVVREGLIAPVTDSRIARMLSDEAMKQKTNVNCQIKIDSGMGRLGFLLEESENLIEKIYKLPGIYFSGIYSHFSSADTDKDFTKSQINKFCILLEKLRLKQIVFPQVHIANSDAINNIQESILPPFTKVRAGINLYGCYNSHEAKKLELEPVIRLKSRLLAVRVLPAGHSIGYGRMHILKKPTKIGTVAIGYADGVPMGINQGGAFVVKGTLCPVIGRVSMDLTTISLESLDEVEVGDEVTCIGDKVHLEDWAKYNNSHSYQILTLLGRRLERRFV